MNDQIRLLGWKIWYGDGSTASSDKDKWENVPNENVQVVSFLVKKPARTRRYNYRGKDYYGFSNKMIYKSNDIQELKTKNCLIKQGKYLDPVQFRTILSKAESDQSLELAYGV